MKKPVTIGRAAMALAVVSVIGVATAFAARPIQPDCGPTRLWSCKFPNGSERIVEGTVCEIRRLRADCVPYAGNF